MVDFPPYRLDLAEERLWKGQKLLPLRRKPFAILRHLIANPRRLVTQDELITHVWQGLQVSESAVRSHLHELRQVLGDGVIETVIGRGYRFIAELGAPEPIAAREPTAPRPERLVVGRDAELAQLRAALARAEKGHRQVCFVTGDPGIGKTTLVDTFLDEVADGGVVSARGQCVEQYGAAEAYLAVIGALRELRASTAGGRVLEAFMRRAPTLLAQVPQLVPDDRLDEVTRRSQGGSAARLVREVIEALEELGATETFVLVLEDMQWSDVATIDLLANFGQRTERTRLLVIVTARQADVQAPAHPMSHVMRSLVARSGALAIQLDRVGSGEIERYIGSRFANHTFPPTFTTIVDRITEGTPLFMVSLLDDLASRGMLVERDGAWALAATLDDVAAHRPDGVRQLIDLQLDRLTAEEQRALEAASLVGLDFAVGLVAASLDASVETIDDLCDGLARRGLFLRRDASEDWPDGTMQMRYRVTHGLVAEVAQGRCAVARAQRWHRKIAERLEAAWGERSSEIAHTLAVHYDHGQVPARAVSNYLVAAERDARRYAIGSSLKLFGRARELIPRVPASPDRDRDALTILRGLAASVIRTTGPDVRDPMAMFEEMIELARRIDDKIALCTSLVNVQVRLCILGEYSRALAIEGQIDALFAEFELPRSMHGFYEVARGLRLYWVGDLRAARDVLEAIHVEGPTVGEATKFGIIGPTDPTTIVRVYLSFTRCLLGDLDGGMEMALRAAEDSRVAGDPYAYGVALCMVARLHLWRGDSLDLVRAAAETARGLVGAEAWHAQAAVLRACAVRRTTLLSPAEADELIAMFVERTAVYPMGKTMFAAFLVDAIRGAGRDERSLQILDEMLAFARDRGEHIVDAELLRLRGEILEATDRVAAETAYREALASARASTAVGLVRRVEASLARRTP